MTADDEVILINYKCMIVWLYDCWRWGDTNQLQVYDCMTKWYLARSDSADQALAKVTMWLNLGHLACHKMAKIVIMFIIKIQRLSNNPTICSNTPTLICSISQHNTTQHHTTQHNTTQHNTTQHNTSIWKGASSRWSTVGGGTYDTTVLKTKETIF